MQIDVELVRLAIGVIDFLGGGCGQDRKWGRKGQSGQQRAQAQISFWHESGGPVVRLPLSYSHPPGLKKYNMSSPPQILTQTNEPTLSRSLRPRHISMITIGGIIGAGLFVGSSVAIAAAGPAIILSYLLTGTLVLLVMRMLGEMAVEMPHVRSFTEFTRAGLGDWAGFSVGWLYWYFWIVVIPVEAIAGAAIIQRWLPEVPTWEIGAVLMALMTGVNLMSARAYGEFEFWFSSIKVAAIITFVIVVGAYVCGFRSPTGPTFSNLVAYGGVAPEGGGAPLPSLGPAVLWVVGGAEVVTIAAAESPEPARAVAKMTSSIIGRIVLFYIGSVLVILCALPWDQVVPGQSPFTAALD